MRPVSEQEYWGLVTGEHATAAAGNPNFVRTGGKYVENPTAGTTGDDVANWRDARGYITPHLLPLAIATVTTAASGSTSTGSGFAGFSPFGNVTIVTDVSLADGAIATMSVLVDTQIAGSGTWQAIAQSSIYTAAGMFAMQLARDHGTNLESTLTADPGVGTLRRVGWGDSIRTRVLVTGTATTSMSAIIYISGVM